MCVVALGFFEGVFVVFFFPHGFLDLPSGLQGWPTLVIFCHGLPASLLLCSGGWFCRVGFSTPKFGVTDSGDWLCRPKWHGADWLQDSVDDLASKIVFKQICKTVRHVCQESCCLCLCFQVFFDVFCVDDLITSWSRLRAELPLGDQHPVPNVNSFDEVGSAMAPDLSW